MALSLKASSNGSRRTWFLRKRVACNPASPAAMSGQGGQGAQLGAPSQASRALDGQGRSPLLARDRDRMAETKTRASQDARARSLQSGAPGGTHSMDLVLCIGPINSGSL